MPLYAVPDPDENTKLDLPPDARRALEAIRVKLAEAVSETSAELAVQAELVKAAYAELNASAHELRDALANAVIFGRSLGAMVTHSGRLAKVAAVIALFILGSAETALGFPGLKYALADHSGSPNPLDHPLSLLAAGGFAIASYWLAHVAGENFKLSSRSVLKDPQPAVIHGLEEIPQVLMDERGRSLVPESPVNVTQPSRSATTPASVVVSKAADPAELHTRFAPLVLDSESRRRRLATAASALVCGVCLWSINGYFRGSYSSLQQADPSTNAVSGLGEVSSPGPSLSAPSSAGAGAMDIAMIGLGVLFFFTMVLICASRNSALSVRQRNIELAVKTAQNSFWNRNDRAQATIRSYEAVRSQIESQRIRAQAEGATATADYV